MGRTSRQQGNEISAVVTHEIVPLLQGDIAWPAVMSALRHIDCNAWLTAELSVPESGRREFFKATREAVARLWSQASCKIRAEDAINEKNKARF